jgi:hypothetical protein
MMTDQLASYRDVGNRFRQCCFGVVAVTCLVSLGCNGEASVSGTQSSRQESIGASTSNSAPVLEKIKFKIGDGKTAFSWKPQADGAKLVDADEKEISRYNRDGTKLKIKGPDDVVLAYVVGSGDQYKVKSADQQKELWELQKQADGDWKLKDGSGKLIYMIKMRPYGFEVEDGNENSLAKIKLKDGKLSLRDPAEKTLYYTKDRATAIAMSCLAFEVVKSLPVRCGLMTMLLLDNAN